MTESESMNQEPLCTCGDNNKFARKIAWSLIAILTCLSVYTGYVQATCPEKEQKWERLKQISQHVHEKKVFKP